MTPRLRTLTVAAAALAIAASRFLSRCALPDDWDAIGLVRALDDFDLQRFQPHFPGYPVQVALGRAAHLVIADPLAAALLISSLASAVTAVALFVIGRSQGGDRVGWTALVLYAAAWLPWQLGGAALSESTAAAFATLAFMFVLIESPSLLLGGCAMGLLLGTRISWWPLWPAWAALVWRTRRAQVAPAIVGSLLGVALWLVPFVAIVGPRALWTLGRAQVKGHFGDWGGSIVTDPSLLGRCRAFWQGLLFDGFAPNPLALLGLLALWVIALVVVRRDRAAAGPNRAIALLLAPYALWVFIAQNVVFQPRHLLPLVLGLQLVLARPLSVRLWITAAAGAVMLAVSLPLAFTRAHSEPAAAQAVRHVVASYPARDVVVIGGRSIRFFKLMAPAITVRERGWLSEVQVDLERLDVLPPHILVTSELKGDAERDRLLGPAITFCRDPRIDRVAPCLSLRPYTMKVGTP